MFLLAHVYWVRKKKITLGGLQRQNSAQHFVINFINTQQSAGLWLVSKCVWIDSILKTHNSRLCSLCLCLSLGIERKKHLLWKVEAKWNRSLRPSSITRKRYTEKLYCFNNEMNDATIFFSLLVLGKNVLFFVLAFIFWWKTAEENNFVLVWWWIGFPCNKDDSVRWLHFVLDTVA